MKKLFLFNSIYSLLLVLIFIASCNGQMKTDSSADNVTYSKPLPPGQPKITKPTGAHKDDNLRCGIQDKAGNLWFGTSGEGVYRYDGKLFTNFTTNDGLASNTVYSILEDKDGIIWFGTVDGICRYDGKNIVPVPINKGFIPTAGSSNYYNFESTKNTVWSIFQDKSGTIWFGTGDGVYCYDGKNFTRFLDTPGIINKDSLQLKMVDDILEDKNGSIWFASGMMPGSEGICRYDGKSITRVNPFGDGWIRSVMEDKNGKLLFVTRHKGVLRYNPSSESFTNISKEGGLDDWSITSVFEDKAGNLWFGEETGGSGDDYLGGLWCYDGKNFTKFTTENGLSNNGVWFIMQGKDGNIWIGSRCNGLSLYDGKVFTNFTE